MTVADGLEDGTTMRVRAGALTDEETVAVLLAIDAALAAERPAQAPPRPAWTVAARQEGVGGPHLATRSSLRGWSTSP